ncbi:MAG: hypothetical protein HONBIEJF_02434 [Fimbriimonadaceae bacterium]|nr:hypothetical protein [Fimbriimonadaceae bacterium]
MIDGLSRLTGTIGRHLVPAEIVDVGTSLGIAAERIHESGRPLLVVDGGRYVGIVRESDIGAAIGDGAESTAPAPLSKLPSLPMTATGVEALRALEAWSTPALAVVDALDQPVGLITPSALVAETASEPRPRVVGGMATPFGVYLTNGAVSGGVGGGALVATGMLLFTMFLVATILSVMVGSLVEPLPWPEAVKSLLIASTSAFAFLGILRVLPLTGYHAAEHMTVHAIERGEPIVKEAVRRMPRVHPRCGTNLAVGATLFMALATTTWIENQELKLLAAAVVSLSLWRPIGSLLQQHVTTRKPSDRQLDAGVRAGRQLLQRFASEGAQPRSIFQKLLLSGMFHIMLGSLLVYALLQVAFWILPIPEAWKVYF